MRIRPPHPSRLDRTGLVACWRETLLAQSGPLAAVGAYVSGVAHEARNRKRSNPGSDRR